MPHENPIVEQKQNPFKQKELENWHPLQEQLIILKSFLRQAAIGIFLMRVMSIGVFLLSWPH